MKNRTLFAAIVLTSFVLSACSGLIVTPLPPPPTNPAPVTTPTWTPEPTDTPFPTPTRRATITVEPTITDVPATVTQVFNPNGKRITFTTEDGQELVGYYYVAPQPESPVIVMMHQLGSNQKVWIDSQIIPWLQNYPSSTGKDKPIGPFGEALPDNQHFNVLTFDFRGHGESGGEKVTALTQAARDGFLLDAKAAYALAGTMPYSDPEIIIGIGLSIGADAAVDTCGQNCQGVFAISPSSSLGITWYNAVVSLLNEKKPVRCVFGKGDAMSASTCTSMPTSSRYVAFGFDGHKHGVDFIIPNRIEFDFGGYLSSFLLEITKR